MARFVGGREEEEAFEFGGIDDGFDDDDYEKMLCDTPANVHPL